MKRIALALLTAGLAFAASAQELFEGYTCCNLHYEKDWISDANWGTFAMIPAGAKIKVVSYGFNRAAVEIDGKPMRIGHDYGRNEESLEKYIGKIVVKTNPKAKLDRYPDKMRAAIREGKVLPGMTREQVIMSVGYPPTHRTPSLESSVWNLWASRAGRYEVHWNSKGTVDKVVGLH
ncbi:MAG: hypothetical protein ACXWAC_09970 [Usitatibacter sp.]